MSDESQNDKLDISKDEMINDLINFNNCPTNLRMYGGLAGNKIGVIYNNDNYLIKYPQDLKNIRMKNVNLSYSNAPICEYLGSHIYEILDIPVHETILGERQGKIVVACKDFLNQGDRLYEFREIKTTFEYENKQKVENETDNTTSGNGVDLQEILFILDNHPVLQQIPEIKKRFWDMFVVDAFIGNSDRNNGNWGIISRYNGKLELSPVYDNGNCLNNKWDDEKIQNCMKDKTKLETMAYKSVFCIFTNKEKKINPFQYLNKTNNMDALKSFSDIYYKILDNEDKIKALIIKTDLLSNIQKVFYTSLLDIRLHKAFNMIYTSQKSYLNIVDKFVNLIKNKEFFYAYKFELSYKNSPISFMKEVVKIHGTRDDVIKSAIETIMNFHDESPEFAHKILNDTLETEEYKKAFEAEHSDKRENSKDFTK